MCVKEANIFLEFVSVQGQYGHSDCGVFAITFTTSLCAGHSPAKTTYIQHLLQPHLIQCLEGVFTEYPSLQRKRKVEHLQNQVVIPIFCECRQPESGRMVQCDQCQVV